MKISEAINDFVAYQYSRRGEDSSTAKGYRTTLNQFLRYTGDKQCASVTNRHVEDFFYGPGGLMAEHEAHAGHQVVKRQPPLSPGTHNLYRTRMVVWVKWCMQRGYIRRDPTINLHPMKNPKKKRLRYGPEVLLSLLEQAKSPRDRILLAVACNTGLRGSEIVRIKVGDVDLAEGFMDVVIRKTGDVDEQPITSDLDLELRRWMTRYAKDIGRPLHAEDYLIPSQRGGLITHYDDGKPVRHPYFWKTDQPVKRPEWVVKYSLEALGLPSDREGIHTIRRSVARAYFDVLTEEKGDVAALRLTAALLHHANTQTTEVYLGLDAEKAGRNRRMRGRPFLSAMVPQENVVPIRKDA